MAREVYILIPIYKATLDSFEQHAVDYSSAVLKRHKIQFIGPENLNRDYYTERYPKIPFLPFADADFATIQGYNRLLLNPNFYARFHQYEFVMILQTDAIVLRDELNFWCRQPFDYVGAPWPDGYQLFLNVGRFEGQNGRYVRVTVGNGGLSLRRVRKCMALLKEFPEAVNFFDQTGSSEDLFFSVMAALSNDFVVPNEITASRFSMELKPSYYYAVNGHQLPMGGHAWWKYEPNFWIPHLNKIPFPRV